MKQVQNVNLAYKAVVDLFIYAHSAESSSILGIVLGNFGLNLNNFSTEFNTYTKDLASYFLLKVRIVVFENRTFSFSCTLASLAYFLKLLALEKERQFIRQGRSNNVVLQGINLIDAIILFRLKFPYQALNKSFPILVSVINSANLKLFLF